MKQKLGSLLMTAMLLCSLPVRAAGSEVMTEQEVAELSQEIGGQYNICPELLQAIAWKESRYDPAASSAGCEGLMQVQERWHKDRMEQLGVTDLYDPAGNMLLAADYLAELFAKYEDVAVVLMYYNGDSQANEYSRGIGSMPQYVADVLAYSEQLERERDGA